MKSVPDHRRGGAEAAELVAREVGEAPAVAARRAEEDQHVLHAAGQHRADEEPQGSRQVAELGRERRSDQGTRARDRGEVMAEHDRAVRRHEVAPVVEALGRRRPRRIEPAHAGGDPAAVEAVADEVGRDGRDHEPERVDALAAMQGDAAECGRARDGDSCPDAATKKPWSRHRCLLPRTADAGPPPRNARARKRRIAGKRVLGRHEFLLLHQPRHVTDGALAVDHGEEERVDARRERLGAKLRQQRHRAGPSAGSTAAIRGLQAATGRSRFLARAERDDGFDARVPAGRGREIGLARLARLRAGETGRRQ